MTLSRKAVLHIGTEKTGTTSLQTFIALNRDRLKHQNFYSPLTLCPDGFIANHSYLTSYSLNNTKLNDDLRVRVNISDIDDVEEHRRVVNAAFRDEMAVLPEANTVVIMSNEHCHSRLTDPAEVVRLREFLSIYFDDIEILVYLRPQHELAISLYDQALRGGYFDIAHLPTFVNGHSAWVAESYFDYAGLLARWSAAFGAAAVKVRIYARGELTGGDLIDDYMKHIHCSMVGMERPVSQNRSLGADFQPTLNALNRRIRNDSLIVSSSERDFLIDCLRALSRIPGSLPERRRAEEFLDQFSVGNEIVRQRFFPNRSILFAPDFTDFPESLNLISEQQSLENALIGILKLAPF